MSVFIKSVLKNLNEYSGTDGRAGTRFTICSKDEESLIILTTAGVVGVFGRDSVTGYGGSLHLSDESMDELAEAWIRMRKAN